MWNYLDQAETNAILYLYKYMDQNQDDEPKIKYKMKKGKLVPLTEDLTYQEKFLLDLSKFIKKERVIAKEEVDKKL